MRSLGGSIGLAIGVIVFNSQIRHSTSLANELTPDQMTALFKSPLTISTLTPEQQALVSRVYATAFTQEMKVATYIAAACFLVSLFTFQRHPPPLPTSPARPTQGIKGDVESRRGKADGNE